MQENEVLLHRLRDGARKIGASVSTMYRLAAAREIDLVKAGAATMVTDASLRRYAESRPKLTIKRTASKRAA